MAAMGRRRQRVVPAATAVLAVAVALGVLGGLAALAAEAPARATVAQRGGGAGVATVSADGWWNATPALPSTVGDQGLGVGARVGEPDKLAALAFDLALRPGARVAAVVLELREVAAPGAVVPPGAEGAAVSACPITRAWGPERNGALADAPAYDCAHAPAPGLRGADGVWRFDLGAVAWRWGDGSAPQHGVALVESVDAPASFQVAFQDRTTGTPRLRVAASPATADPGSGPGAADPAGQAATRGGSPARFAPVPDLPAPAPRRGAALADGGRDVVPADPGPPPLAARAAARSAGPGVLGAVPASALLLVPAVLAVALGACLVIGDERSAEEGRRRQGAVTRALAGGVPAR